MTEAIGVEEGTALGVQHSCIRAALAEYVQPSHQVPKTEPMCRPLKEHDNEPSPHAKQETHCTNAIGRKTEISTHRIVTEPME